MAGLTGVGLFSSCRGVTWHARQDVMVEELYDTGETETVYNLRIADYHTYFVGRPEWGWSAWAHNDCIASAARRAAVKKAWKQEADLVRRSGDGTRVWTDAQKAELLANGKVSGFVGHHINSVAESPLLAGVADNVTFLEKAEHLMAHGGNWATATFGALINRGG